MGGREAAKEGRMDGQLEDEWKDGWMDGTDVIKLMKLLIKQHKVVSSVIHVQNQNNS